MKKLILNCVAMLVAVAFMTSCSQDEVTLNKEGEVPADVLEQVLNSGYSTQDIKVIKRTNPITKQVEEGYMLEGDMFVGLDQVDDVFGKPMLTAPEVEQYRTNNLVTGSNRTIDIIGYTGSGNALSSQMQTGLQWAVNNYNRLNISLDFRLTYGTAYQDKDMVVYNNNQSGGGGSAGFPSGGAPYKWVQINAGTSSFGNNVCEHVICHEIGHSVGFRHTDFFNRSLSCGTGGNEGDGGVGAIHIPGTPTGQDASSIMAACFSANEDGEFNANDITALEYLY